MKSMCYSSKIVLHCPRGPTPGLQHLVRAFLWHNVRVVALVGEDCSGVERLIAEIAGGDARSGRSLLTINHAGESVQAAVAMVQCMTGDYEGDEVQVIELMPS